MQRLERRYRRNRCGDGGDSIIRGCYNIGSVTARDGAVGGIVGHLSAGGNGTSVRVTVSACYNMGIVTAR